MASRRSKTTDSRSHIPSRARRAPLCALAVSVATLAAAPGANAGSKFYGLQAWYWPSTGEFHRMAQGGAGAFRVPIDWFRVQPGGPQNYDWSAYDRIVADTSRYDLTLVPNLVGTPKWAYGSSRNYRPGYPPRGEGRKHFAAFIRRVVARYGPKARFRGSHPTSAFKPIHYWQAWNEPNIAPYAPEGKPNARHYVGLLKLMRKAIKSQDRDARIILAGLPESKHGVPMARFLEQIYKVRGARSQFDAVAIHPYAKDERGVEGALIRVRRIMRHYGDRTKPTWITEFGWASGGPRGPFVKSWNGQATAMRRTYIMLKKKIHKYHIGMVAWFSWRDRKLNRGERNWWAPHTGVFTVGGRPKPAWEAFARIAHGDPGDGRLRNDPPSGGGAPAGSSPPPPVSPAPEDCAIDVPGVICVEDG